jgi:DNA-binding response OmpR family regulator
MIEKRGMLPSRAEHEPPKALRSLRILIVDDDRDAALTLMMILRDEGHDVRALYSGRNVAGAMIDFGPDAVIIDIEMPDMSGWQIARIIRERRNRPPLLIAISGHYTKGVDEVVSRLCGFDHYFTKPCMVNDLLKIFAPLR